MARQLPLAYPLTSTSQAGLAAATLLLCALALFMCASHSRKWRRRWSACYGCRDQDPIIQLDNGVIFLPTKRVHGVEARNGEESAFGGEDQDASVWQKNILMGGKCQLPDFSGVIIYDSAGNIISPAKNSRAILS
ncbi:hypothetical protein L1049_025920 [Liquidambar formosana]|uniref:Uncharacterized protein n=1 Tax=Liquidambar formosana TaxID=63359 RepID=A0AAP0NDQ7_LIQFO